MMERMYGFLKERRLPDFPYSVVTNAVNAGTSYTELAKDTKVFQH